MTAVTRRILDDVVDTYDWDASEREAQAMHAEKQAACVDHPVEFSVRVVPPPAPPTHATLTGYRIETGRRLIEFVEERTLERAVREYRKYGTHSELYALAEFYSDAVGGLSYKSQFDADSEAWGAWVAE